MKKLKVYFNKEYFTPDYLNIMKPALFRLAENYTQLENYRNYNGDIIEAFNIEATDDMANAILALSVYEIWYAEEII